MNKLTIPTILVATVMVAGMFAFIPVEQASTVHTSGTITSVNDLQSETIASAADVDNGETFATLSCDGPFVVLAINIDGDGDFLTTAPDEVDVFFDPDGAGGANWDNVPVIADFVAVERTATNFDDEMLAGGSLAGLTDGEVTLVFSEDNDDSDESFRTQFLVESTGDCDAT